MNSTVSLTSKLVSLIIGTIIIAFVMDYLVRLLQPKKQSD